MHTRGWVAVNYPISKISLLHYDNYNNVLLFFHFPLKREVHQSSKLIPSFSAKFLQRTQVARMFSGKQNKCKWQNRIRHPTEGLPASLGTDEITNYSFRPVQLLFFFLFLVKLHPIIYFFLIRLGPKHKNSTNKPGPLLYVFVSISGVKEFRWSGQVLSVSWCERIPLICTKKEKENSSNQTRTVQLPSMHATNGLHLIASLFHL